MEKNLNDGYIQPISIFVLYLASDLRHRLEPSLELAVALVGSTVDGVRGGAGVAERVDEGWLHGRRDDDAGLLATGEVVDVGVDT